MTMTTKIILAPFHKCVSIRNKPIEIEINTNSYFSHKVNRNPKKIDGIYARYPESLFLFFEYDSQIYLGWKNIIINSSLITHAKNSFSLSKGINIDFYSDNDLLLNVNYMTLYRFAKNPFSSFFDLFFPDEWWDYTQDLPGEVYSAIEMGESLKLMLKDWINSF